MHRIRGVKILCALALMAGLSVTHPATAAAQVDHCLTQCVDLDRLPSTLAWRAAGTQIALRWVWSKEESWVLSGLTTASGAPSLLPKAARGGVRAVRFLSRCPARDVGPKLGLVYEDGTASWHRLHLTTLVWEEEPLPSPCPMVFSRD